MKKTIASLVIISIFVFTSNVFAQNVTADFSKATPFNAALRSALMPGWGQGWNEQPTKGWIVFGVFAASVFGAFYYNNQAFGKYDEYKNFGAIDGPAYSDYERYRSTSQVFTVLAIGTWLYAVIDAYFTCKSQIAAGPAAKTSAFNFQYDPNRAAYIVNYSYKI